VVYIDPSDDEEGGLATVGIDAVEAMDHDPDNVFYGIKRWLGRRFAEIDPSQYEQMPFNLQECRPSLNPGWADEALAKMNLGSLAPVELFDSAAFVGKPCISAKSSASTTSLMPLELISGKLCIECSICLIF
jgi:hypothetical protein